MISDYGSDLDFDPQLLVGALNSNPNLLGSNWAVDPSPTGAAVIRSEAPQDPNEIVGLEGYDAEGSEDTLRWVSPTQRLAYTIYFENDSAFATAAASKVTITMPLHEKLDYATFGVGSFGFGSYVFSVEGSPSTYQTRIDLRDTLGIDLDVVAGLDIVNHEAFWIFQSIDPATGLPPTDINLGFLAINDSLHSGEGFVTCTIKPLADACVTGDTVTATASIVFDVNEAIETNTWLNTVDAVAPTSTLTMTTNSAGDMLTAIFDGEDDEGGCGVKQYKLYYSVNDNAYQLYSVYPAGNSVEIPLETGMEYDFFVLAEDNVGNCEPMKNQPEYNIGTSNFTLTVEVLPQNAGTVNGGGSYPLGDTAQLAATAAEGYHFVRWMNRGVPVSTDNPYQVEVTQNQTYTAFFELNQYTLQIDAAEGSAITVTDFNGNEVPSGSTILHFDQLQVRIDTSDCYTMESVLLNGASYVPGETLTVTGDITFTTTTEPVLFYADEYLTICDTDLPYTYRDTVFEVGSTESSIFDYRFSTDSSCDSIVTLHLTVENCTTINVDSVVVTITGHHKTTTYDGSAHTVTGYDVTINNPLYTEADFMFSGDSIAARTEEGTTYMGLAESQFANTNSNFTNVTFNVTDGYQTIVPADVVVVTITGHHDAAMYDGEEHNVSGYDVEISTPLYTEADFTFNGTATVGRTNAGTTSMGLAAEQFVNTSTNFATVLFDVSDGYQTITQRNVTLASASDSREYNGDSLTNHNVTVGGAGFVAGEGATYEFTGGQLLPGSSSNTFTYTLNSGTLTENYNIAMVFGTLTVENRPVAERYVVEMVSNTIPVSIDEPIVYDGLEHTIEDFVTHTFTVNGHTYTVSGLTASVTQIFAGTYENAIMGDAVVTDEYGNDVTAQFDVHYTPGTLTISKRLITFTIENPEDATKVYDGTPLTITFDKLHVDGLAETDELIDGTLISSSAEVGEYTIEDGNMFYMMATGTFTKSGFKIKHSLYPSMLAKTLASYSASISLSGSITAIECDGVTYQGHPYEAVQIGTQCWLAENLRNTATAAGPISYVAYNEDDANAAAFGYLYTWYTAVGVPEGDNTTVPTTATTTSGETYVQGICPDGWAIPSHTDMEILKNFASGEVRRLRDMSTSYWIGGLEGITPNYAFNSRGGGFYNSVSGDFERMLLEAYYWESNSEPGTTEVTTLVDAYYCSDMLFKTTKKSDKRSVRCIRKVAH